jgi:hypothetical protein
MLLAGALLAMATPLCAQLPLSVPATGREAELTLQDGTRLRGELIEATSSRLLLAGASRASSDLFEVRRVRVRQHHFSGTDALLWVGIGAVVSGLGMAAACSQVDDTDCAGVFPAVAGSFVLFGGLFSIGMTSSGWREVPVDPEALRAYARFPRGAPAGFTP